MSAKLVTLGGLSLKGAAFVRPKPLLLLAYLALEGPRDRYHLAELFWRDSANPLNSLAAAVMQLKQGAPGVVEADKRQVRSVVACDAGEFLAAFEGGRYEEVLALYQGPFLNGVYLPGWGAELEEWVYSSREFMGGRAREALLRLGEGMAAEGRFEEAVKRAEAAYLLPGAPEAEPEELARFHVLLVAGRSPQLARFCKDAQDVGLEPSLSFAEARERLQGRPEDTPSPPQALPTRATSFIGRDVERVEVANLLAQPRCRLLTLTGPGGVGKSRLALRVAHDVSEHYAGGVHFIPLEALASPSLVPFSIAGALTLPLQGSENPLTQIARHIGDKAMLLVLDNYEHLLDGAALVSRLLQDCPHLRVLVTSRERLTLEEEWVLPLEGLALPTKDVLPAEARYHDALRLFLERAKRARLSFEMTAEDLPHAVRICNSVQGLPLGIELAAAWVKLLSCRDIAQELVQNLDFLSSPNRNAPDRHKSIRAVFEGSWRLLTPKEQEVLRKLSVFRGGFRREAAAEVAGATIPVLASLVDKSLLRLTARSKYDAHPLLHQYTQEKLFEQPDAEQTHEQHASYFLVLAEEAEPHFTDSQQAIWLDRLEAEHDNLRAALVWLKEHEVEKALRLAGALWRFWSVRGYLSEGRSWLEAALAHPEAAKPTPARAKALHGIGVLLWNLGDYALSRPLLEEGLAIRRKLGDKPGIAGALNTLGLVTYRQGDYATARSLHAESLAIDRELGDKRGMALSLGYLWGVFYAQGDYAAARSLLEESIVLRRELGDKAGIAFSLTNLGSVAHAQGDYAAARSLYEESLATQRELGNKAGIAYCLGSLGLLAHDEGDHATARSLYEESLAVGRKLTSKWGIAQCLEGLASVATAQAEPSRAARLWGTAEALRQAIGAPLLPVERSRYESDIAAARSQLDEAVFKAAWAEGRMMPLEEIISYALKGMMKA